MGDGYGTMSSDINREQRDVFSTQGEEQQLIKSYLNPGSRVIVYYYPWLS